MVKSHPLREPRESRSHAASDSGYRRDRTDWDRACSTAHHRRSVYSSLVHTPLKVSSLSAPQVEVMLGEFEDLASLDRAVAGVERVFLVSPPHPDQVRLQGNVVKAAQR